MKLYTSHTSPTARAIILTALAQGKDALQLAYADPWTTPPELTAINPFSQVPVLITADGTAIYNTLTIADYLFDHPWRGARQSATAGYATALLEQIIKAYSLARFQPETAPRIRTSNAPARPWFAVSNMRHDLTRPATPSNSICWQWHSPMPNCATLRSIRIWTQTTVVRSTSTANALKCARSAPKRWKNTRRASPPCDKASAETLRLPDTEKPATSGLFRA